MHPNNQAFQLRGSDKFNYPINTWAIEDLDFSIKNLKEFLERFKDTEYEVPYFHERLTLLENERNSR